MDYKTLLVNSTAYSRISKAKELLSRRLGAVQSVSDLITEALGRSIDFIDIDNGLRAYIKEFAGTLAKSSHILGVLLFGSIAKGVYGQYSDIDMFIIIDDRCSKAEALHHVSETRKGLEGPAMRLAGMRIPSWVSPLVVHASELRSFTPIYLDVLDYGVVLYDYRDTVANFLDSTRKIKHTRRFTQSGEVITWQA